MAEREALLAHRTALSGLRESTVAADPEIEPAARKRGRLGRRRPAAVHSDGATAEAARHVAAPGQPGAPQSGPVSPFESFRTPEVVSAPAVERPADDPDLADGDSRLGPDEQHDAPEHIDVDAAVEGDGGARTGWSRRTLGWLLAPAEQPQQREPSTEETAPGDEDDRVRAPEQHGLPPWRLLPDVEPAAPARANRPEPEPVAEQPVPVPPPVPEPQPLSEPKPEPAAAAGAAEHPPVGPGTDLPRRLAAANAAAMARALASEAYDFPEDDDDDGDVPQQRRAAAFVRPSGPRPAGIARERDETAATSSPLVTGTAFAQRNVPPADIDADGPTPVVAKRHRVTVRGAARLLVVVVIAAVIATLLRTYVIAPYYIPSASMEPTLHGCTGCNNDHVLVDKLSYKMHDIHRGDVVVFHRPKAWQVTDQVLVKRVIGLPGDKLSARNGIVYVDGLALEEPYLDKACQSGTTNFPTKPVTVPDGEAYVMGDNRCDSSDSRRFGAIPDSAVIGRAFLIVWPLGRLHWL
jgi:signal peptidase I